MKVLENFSKRKGKSEAEFYLLSHCAVFSIKVVLQYHLENNTLRVASKIWVGIDLQLHEFYWPASINNGRKKCKHNSKPDLRHIIFERSMPENL